MIISITKAVSAIFLTAVLGGCVSVPTDAGFGSVQQTVLERTGQRVQWDRSAQGDRKVLESVRALLRHDPLSESDAIQVALLNNQNLQATYEELGIAQADLVEAGLLRNPSISAEVRFPSRPALPYEINLTQSFLDLLMLPIRKRSAEAGFEAAKLRVTDEVLNMATEVKAAFYRAQGAEQLVEMRQQIAATTAASFEAARSLHEAGNISDLNFSNEQAMHEQAKVDLAQAEAGALDLREELSALMGTWGSDTNWKIATRLPDMPRVEAGTSGLESLAISQRADLGAARQKVEVAAQSLGLTRFSAFSDISVGAHLQKDLDGSLTVGPAIDIPIPIFNQGQPAVAAAQARFRQSRNRYVALAVEIRGQIRRKRNEMISARQRAEYYSAMIVPLRHQIVQQTQLQYNAMTIGVFQLLEAKRAEIEAGRDYVQALQDYWVAHAELERAVGGRLPSGISSIHSMQDSPQSNNQPAEHAHTQHGD